MNSPHFACRKLSNTCTEEDLVWEARISARA
jgi:hypothetical protein